MLSHLKSSSALPFVSCFNAKLIRIKMNATNVKNIVLHGRDVDFSKKLIVTIVYAIIEVFGLCSNALLILTIFCGRRRFQTNYYRLVFQLAVCDIVLLLTGNLTSTVGPWIENSYWSSTLGHATCIAVHPFVSCLFHTELALLITIAILRYKAVTKPHRPTVSAKKLRYIIALAYIAPVFFTAPKFLSQQVTARECTSKWKDNIYFHIYYSIDNIVITLVSMMFLIVLYTKMCYSMALHQQNLRSFSSAELGSNVGKRHHFLRMKKNAKMVTVSVIVLAQFCAAVLPIRVLNQLVIYGKDEEMFHLVWVLPLYFLVSCSFNPMVYGFGDKTIREGYRVALKKILYRQRPRSTVPDDV